MYKTYILLLCCRLAMQNRQTVELQKTTEFYISIPRISDEMLFLHLNSNKRMDYLMIIVVSDISSSLFALLVLISSKIIPQHLSISEV